MTGEGADRQGAAACSLHVACRQQSQMKVAAKQAVAYCRVHLILESLQPGNEYVWVAINHVHLLARLVYKGLYTGV
jgi:hypothetical protein